jgi:hypothetical protein
MNASLPSRADFEQLLAEHLRLIHLANVLEFQLHLLGESPPDSPAAGCQQAAGALLGALRNFLFRQDQHVLPVLESLIDRED